MLNSEEGNLPLKFTGKFVLILLYLDVEFWDTVGGLAIAGLNVLILLYLDVEFWAVNTTEFVSPLKGS